MESFLHKDVSFVVTGNLACLQEKKHGDTKAGSRGTSEETQRPIMTQESVLSSDKRRPGTPRPMVNFTHESFHAFYSSYKVERTTVINIIEVRYILQSS